MFHVACLIRRALVPLFTIEIVSWIFKDNDGSRIPAVCVQALNLSLLQACVSEAVSRGPWAPSTRQQPRTGVGGCGLPRSPEAPPDFIHSVLLGAMTTSPSVFEKTLGQCTTAFIQSYLVLKRPLVSF